MKKLLIEELDKFLKSSSITTNCYENVSMIVDRFIKIKEYARVIKIVNLDKLYEIIYYNTQVDDVFLYDISLRISTNKTINIFNHNFIIIQYYDNFIMCDSWEAMHYFKCRKHVKYPIFLLWFEKLKKYTNEIKEEHNLYDLFREDPFENDINLTKKQKEFQEDYDKLLDLGEYVLKWSRNYNVKKYESVKTNLVIQMM